MNRKLSIVLVTMGSMTAVAMLAFVIGAHGAVAASPAVAANTAAAPQGGAQGPDTSSPNWKQLSQDVGVMIRNDERLGLRGRLYVNVDGSWKAVAIDGPADSRSSIPMR
jgi:hypothetical protein